MCDIMCAKKKANFALRLTNWLYFEVRKILLETVLQILLIYVATLAARLQLLQVGDVLRAALLAWSGSLDLRTAVVSGISNRIALMDV